LPNTLSDIRQGNRQLKIWCAGCSTGEEPYSLAIWLESIIDDIDFLNIKIIATDINTNSLAKAKSGIYTKWSFRDTPSWVKSKYFIKHENNYILDESLKKRVKFFYLNLIDNSYPSILNDLCDVDIILCRNVLMYFNKENHKKVIDQFYKTLCKEGHLLVSSVEMSQEMYKNFEMINFNNFYVYKKSDKKEVEYFNYLVEPTKISVQEMPKSIESEISDLESKYIKAYDFYLEKKYQQAENILLDLYQSYQNHSDNEHQIIKTILLLAHIYANNRLFEKAEYWSNKGLELDSLNIGLHYFMAILFQEQNKFDQAIQSLQKVLYLQPDFILAHFYLGIMNHNQQKVLESKKHFNRALNILSKMNTNDIVPESEQMTVKQMINIINKQLKNNL
ncbi:MAG: hypothetical protein H7263_03335, partial [Candidatus Sericytochromatia bacterium]|nr:hypothetical protein [Candidatus Sericytochromatia bacterium]